MKSVCSPYSPLLLRFLRDCPSHLPIAFSSSFRSFSYQISNLMRSKQATEERSGKEEAKPAQGLLMERGMKEGKRKTAMSKKNRSRVQEVNGTHHSFNLPILDANRSSFVLRRL